MPGQKDSVFAPGLTVRGPVYNALGALPPFLEQIPTPVLLGAIAGVSWFAAKALKSSLPYLAGSAAVVYVMSQRGSALPVGNYILPDGSYVASKDVTPVGTTGRSFSLGGQTYVILQQTDSDANGVAQYYADASTSLSGAESKSYGL